MDESEIERAVGEIWCKAFRVPELHPESSFHELGGDSMLMMNILARIRSELGVELDEKVLLFAPTLREFSMAVAEAARQTVEAPEIDEGVI